MHAQDCRAGGGCARGGRLEPGAADGAPGEIVAESEGRLFVAARGGRVSCNIEHLTALFCLRRLERPDQRHDRRFSIDSSGSPGYNRGLRLDKWEILF